MGPDLASSSRSGPCLSWSRMSALAPSKKTSRSVSGMRLSAAAGARPGPSCSRISESPRYVMLKLINARKAAGSPVTVRCTRLSASREAKYVMLKL